MIKWACCRLCIQQETAFLGRYFSKFRKRRQHRRAICESGRRTGIESVVGASPIRRRDLLYLRYDSKEMSSVGSTVTPEPPHRSFGSREGVDGRWGKGDIILSSLQQSSGGESNSWCRGRKNTGVGRKITFNHARKTQ